MVRWVSGAGSPGRVEPDEASCTDEDCEEEEERRYSRYLTYVELDQQVWLGAPLPPSSPTFSEMSSFE